ncbi:MAG: type II toxin-antitoxin system VapC family toxin [Spirochaetales bacterium]|nr:type II toxin-antitoxin system VapC family toxin [Spirochaetales bacterium]
MKFLLDTNVLSELRKKNPSQEVLRWFRSIPEEHLFLSFITLGEISRGIWKLPEGRQKNELISWFDRVQESFQYQTYTINTDTAVKWGELTSQAEKEGVIVPAFDGLIAATAYINGAILVTRNSRDFLALPRQVLNPWL